MSEATSSLAVARHLLRSIDLASLSTLDRFDGPPHASLVLMATAPNGAPLLLISTLAEHTQNLMQNGRGSVLLNGTAGYTDPLTGPRLTVRGQFEEAEEDTLHQRFLKRHPSSEIYADFADFTFYRMAMTDAHLVAGFGKIETLAAKDLLLERTGTGSLAAHEGDILEHMNTDHADAVRLYATTLCGLGDGPWRMTGIDSEGFDMRLDRATARCLFDDEVVDSDGARGALVQMVKKARQHSK